MLKHLTLTVTLTLALSGVVYAQGRLPADLGTNGGVKVECWNGVSFGACSSGGAGTDVNIAAIDGIPIATANLPVACIVGCAGGTTDTDDGSIAAGQVTSIPANLNYIYNGATWARLTFGQTTMANSIPVTIASNQSALAVTGTFFQATQPVSNAGVFAVQLTGATNNINNISGTISLPTGASTLAEQQTQTTALQLIDNIVSGAGVNITQVGGTNIDTNSGVKSAGTVRVVLATDQPALTNKLLVTPDSVALPANQSVNVNQFGGNAVVTGVGPSGSGIPRVTNSRDDITGNVALTVASVAGAACPAVSNTAVTTSTSCITIPVIGYAGVAGVFQAGTSTGTMVTQGSFDGGTTWSTAVVQNSLNSQVASYVFTNPNAETTFNFLLGNNVSHVRVFMNSCSAACGSVNVILRSSSIANVFAIGALTASQIGQVPTLFGSQGALKAQTGVPTAVANGVAVNWNGDVYGVPFVRVDHPNRVKCVITTTATTSTVVTGCAAPAAGLSIYVTDISQYGGITHTATTASTVQSGTGGTCGTATAVLNVCQHDALHGCEAHFITPLRAGTISEVCILDATVGTKWITISGYIAP